MCYLLQRLVQYGRIVQHQGIGGLTYRLKRKLSANIRTASQVVAADLSRDELATDGPVKFSVLIPLFRPERALLELAIASVFNQTYANFELCVSDDATGAEWLSEYLQGLARNHNVSIVERPTRGHIAANSNSALALAKGDYVVLLDQDDCLAPEALAHLGNHIAQNPGVDLIYSDEQKIDQNGKVIDRTEKPAWSPRYFERYMYVGHLKCVRREKLMELGGFTVGMDGAQDYDLVLRLSRSSARISHLPRILYSWRAHAGSVAGELYAKKYAYANARRALSRYFGESSRVQVVDGIYPGVTRPIVPFDSGQDRYRVVSWGASKPNQKPWPGQFNQDFIEELSKPNLLRLLGTAEANGAKFIALAHYTAIPYRPNAVMRLIEELKVEGVRAVSGLAFDSATDLIVSAGARSKHGVITRNFEGINRFESGPGLRLVTGFDIECLAPECFAVRCADLSTALSEVSPEASSGQLVIALSRSLASRGSLVFSPYALFSSRSSAS